MTGDGRRAQRIAGSVREYVGAALGRELGDRALSELCVTSVDVTDDLSIARIRVRRLGDDADAQTRAMLVRRLESAAHRLRQGLGRRLRLRRVPELEFFWDDGQDAAARVQELLKEIADERGK